jgi:hypothetical protein
MNTRLQVLVSGFEHRDPADVRVLREIATSRGVGLPDDYVEFMEWSDGAAGDVGSRWLECWSVSEIREATESPQSRYEGVLLFAANGGNTIYGFDSLSESEIVEGDWIGLSRDELVRHGRSFTEFLERLASDFP